MEAQGYLFALAFFLLFVFSVLLFLGVPRVGRVGRQDTLEEGAFGKTMFESIYLIRPRNVMDIVQDSVG